jgi:alkylation response protein AidB-like acyl-CoA dehydrogenase
MPFSMELTEDQTALQKWVHGFAADVVRPAAAEWDEREETPWPIIQEAAKIGLYDLEFLGMAYFDESGLSIPILMEELFWGDAGIGLSIIGTTLATAGILANGTGDQVGEWVPQCFGTVDDIQVAALCVSEPGAGSDVSSLRTTARYDEATDEWVLNGAKAWATNGGIANIHVVVASVDRELGARGQASFVVPPGTKGLTQGSKYKKHGIRASHTAEVLLDNVRVPGRCLLGGKEKLDGRLAKARERLKAQLSAEQSAGSAGGPGGPANGSGAVTAPGDRTQAAMATFEASRPAVGAQAVGIARAAYEVALDYTREREQFGRPVADNQSIAFTLADMRTRIDAARLLTWRAAWMGRQGKPFTAGEGSMSKLVAGETAVWVTQEAIRLLGGAGFTRDYPVERFHRDASIYTIFEGTSEIQRLVISRAITGRQIR